MKNLIVGFLFIGAIVATKECRAATLPYPQEDAPEAVNMFYADLAPYGEWIEFQPGFYAWHPTILDPGWRPYMEGHWVWSNYGWYWVSAEPFGWATYHYGRWYFDDVYGWIWIPDTIWGPAWVEWRCNDDYIGWAPLPPYARFHLTVGIRFTRRWAAPPLYWSFISFTHFASGRPYRAYAPESYTRRLISTTRSAGRYQIDQNRIIDVGVERSLVEQRATARIRTAEVTEVPQRGVERITADGSREQIEIYRPRPGDARVGPAGVVARKAETRPPFDFEPFNRGRNAQQRGYQSSPPNVQVPQRGSQEQHPQYQQPQDNRRDQSPEINRDRFLRSRPQLPAPRIERSAPRRPAETKDQRRPGRKRDRF